MAIYAIRVHQRFGSEEELLNTFAYKDTAGTPSAADLLNEFKADVWAAVRSVQGTHMNTFRIQVINMNNPVDSVDSAEDLQGTLAGTGGLLAPYYCLSVRRSIEHPGQRNSYHRIAGQYTGNINSGSARWTPAFKTAVVGMTDNLGALVESASAAYEPVQVASGWKLGEVPVERRSLLGVWQFNDYPLTQNSRKHFYYNWQIT